MPQTQTPTLTTLREDRPAGARSGNAAFNEEEVQRKLKPFDSPHNTPRSSPKAAKLQDLRYTKFSINGFPGVKHALFIPDTLSVTAPLLEQICAAIDREMPSMLLCGVSSLCHPTKMSTAQLRKCPGFGPLMTEVRNSLGLPKVPPEGYKDSDSTSRKIVDVVDHVLEKKLASTVSNIAAAAFRTNVWSFSGPQISNFEIFMQQCIENRETDCFRLVAAHMQDKSYMESPVSKQMMRDLYDGSQGLANVAVECCQPVMLAGDLWDQTKHTANPEFAEHGYDYWSFDSIDQKMITGHPITLWPWPHADLFFLFYREETITGTTAIDVDWEFTTASKLDVEAVPCIPENLAPLGYVFIGAPYCWQPQMKKRLLHGIKLANPIVLLDNTPNLAKQVALFVKIVRKVWDRQPLASCRPFLAGESFQSGNLTAIDLLQAMSPAKIMKHIEKEFDSSGMNADERLTLSDAVGLLDLVKRRPQAFKETVCTVDPLIDSAEHSISQVMSVFTSSHSCAKELNSTEIHHSLVLKAWDVHLKLERRANRLRGYANLTVVSIALLMLVSTTLAMIRVYLMLLNEQIPHEVMLNGLLVFFPIIVLLLMTVQASFQLGQAWASVHMGSSRVVSEIFYFLGNVGRYSGSPALSQKRFMKRLREMVKRLTVSGIREEDLVRSNSGLEKAGASGATDLERLEAEVKRSLYGIRPMCYPCRVLRDLFRSWGMMTWSSLLDYPDQRDLTAPINAEVYVEMRMAPLKKYYSEWVRSLAQLRMVLHCILMLVLSVSVGLGATDFSIWIPVSLACATCVNTLINWLTPTETFVALNNALTVLHKLDLCWQGSEIRENRSEATKRRLITVTENLVLNVERAASRSTAVLEVDDDDAKDSDGEEAAEAMFDFKREAHSRAISVPITPFNVGSGTVTPMSLGRKPDKFTTP